jgi:hypothetical protein
MFKIKKMVNRQIKDFIKNSKFILLSFFINPFLPILYLFLKVINFFINYIFPIVKSIYILNLKIIFCVIYFCIFVPVFICYKIINFFSYIKTKSTIE